MALSAMQLEPIDAAFEVRCVLPELGALADTFVPERAVMAPWSNSG
jgi:hypothetical protein